MFNEGVEYEQKRIIKFIKIHTSISESVWYMTPKELIKEIEKTEGGKRKMTTEFNLSNKRCGLGHLDMNNHYHEEDVREFIRLLKDEIKDYCSENDTFNLSAHHKVQMIINKLAGDKLI